MSLSIFSPSLCFSVTISSVLCRCFKAMSHVRTSPWQGLIDRPFCPHGSHIDFIRFKEYYGMPRGHSLSIYVRFSCKKRTSPYISREKGNHYYIQTWHSDLLFPLQFFLGKLEEKLAWKVHINTERVYWIMPTPPGHPIILLKSNLFNMATVSVKRSISLSSPVFSSN